MVRSTDTRRGKNGRHGLVGQFRQSVFGRLGGYDDVNDADRLSLDPVTHRADERREVWCERSSCYHRRQLAEAIWGIPFNVDPE